MQCIVNTMQMMACPQRAINGSFTTELLVKLWENRDADNWGNGVTADLEIALELFLHGLRAGILHVLQTVNHL